MIAQTWKQLQTILSTKAAHRIAVVAVILLAAGLRFHLLGAQSLWNDEGTSFAMTQRALPDILVNTAADIHPPGYYILLAGWVQIAGASEFALRALSALQSILTVALTYAIGRRLFGRDAGLIAAVFLASNTFAIYYAQETRMYAQLGLFAAAGMWMLVVWLRPGMNSRAKNEKSTKVDWKHETRRQNTRYALTLSLINAAGLYTQYAYPLTLVVQGLIFLAWLWWRWRSAKPDAARTLGLYIAANALTLILFAPWIGEAIRQVTTWPNSGVSTEWTQIIDTAIFGLTAPGYGLASAGVLGVIIFAAVGLSFGQVNRAALIPVGWVIVLGGAFLALGLAPDDLKSLLPITTAAALWLGLGVAVMWRNFCPQNAMLVVIGLGAMLPTLWGGLTLLYIDPAYQRNDYRGMAAAVSAAPRPGDAVILDGPGQGEVWSYYADGQTPVYPLPRNLGGDDEATRAELNTILAEHERIFVLFWGEAERDPNRVVETTLDSQVFEVSTRWYGDTRFVTYAVPNEAANAPTNMLNARFGEDITLEGFALSSESFLPGEVITLTLFWQTDRPLETRYKVFLHLSSDPNAPPSAQRDSEPGGGLAPTITWTPGETIIDRHGLLIPPDLPADDYVLLVGLYEESDPLARLMIGQEDRLILGTVRVGP